MGALGWFSWSDQTHGSVRMVGNEGTYIAITPYPLLQDGVRYIIKMQVETIAGQGGLYSFKMWEDGQPEPVDWLMTAQELLTDPQNGAFLLLAHHVDATFGNITVIPLP